MTESKAAPDFPYDHLAVLGIEKLQKHLGKPVVKENNWKDMPCGVPGYSTTALEYANIIKQHCDEGKFVLALAYLEAAQAHNVLHRMEFAIQETLT